MTDIEIAQAHEMKKIVDVAAKAGIDEKHLELYGNYKAKLDLSEIRKLPRKAKLILVTAISPTPAGEGKTTTSVGLADALNKLGKNTMVCLREPSLGPVFGVLFYLLVIIAAISSAISLMEVVPSSTRRRALSRRVCIPSAMAVSRSVPVSQRWEIIVRIRGVISMIS